MALVNTDINFRFSFFSIFFMETSGSLMCKCVMRCFFLLAHFCSELYRILKGTSKPFNSLIKNVKLVKVVEKINCFKSRMH